MTTKDYIILGFGFTVIALWIAGLVRGWSELVYERKKDDALTWWWLRILRIAQTRENCVTFIRACSVAGIILVGAGTLFAVFAR